MNFYNVDTFGPFHIFLSIILVHNHTQVNIPHEVPYLLTLALALIYKSKEIDILSWRLFILSDTLGCPITKFYDDFFFNLAMTIDNSVMALSHIAGSAIRTRNGWQRKSTVVRQMFLFMSRCSSFMPPNPKIFYWISNFVSRWIIFCIRRCTLTQSVNVWQGHYTLFLPVCMSNHIITFQNYSAPPLGDEHFYQVDFTIWIIILYSLQSYTIFFDCLIVIKKYYRIKWNKYTTY